MFSGRWLNHQRWIVPWAPREYPATCCFITSSQDFRIEPVSIFRTPFHPAWLLEKQTYQKRPIMFPSCSRNVPIFFRYVAVCSNMFRFFSIFCPETCHNWGILISLTSPLEGPPHSPERCLDGGAAQYLSTLQSCGWGAPVCWWIVFRDWMGLNHEKHEAIVWYDDMVDK